LNLKKKTDDDVREMEEKMNQLRMEMHKVFLDLVNLIKEIILFKMFFCKSKEFSSANEKAIESEMISIKHRYLEIQEQLAMAEKVAN
jgi:hypothetical protein